MSAVKDTNNIPKLLKDWDGILDRVAKKVGLSIQNKLIDKITNGDPSWPPNAIATIEKKGSSRPWIDEGEMIQLIENETQSVRIDGINPKVVQVGIFEHEKGLIAHFLEFGTLGGSISAGGVLHTWNHIPPRPLFTLVFEEEELNIHKMVIDEINKELDKYCTLKVTTMQ